jgi:hypothetical protein
MFGAIGEYLEQHEKLPSWIKWPRLVFVSMVALSLVGEFISDAGVFLASHKLQTISDAEYADVNKKAGEAAERADKLELQAATLRKEAEDERSARIEIEDRVAWRRFTELQRSSMASRLIRFSGQWVVILYNPYNDEAAVFASDIFVVLHAAKWNTSAPFGTVSSTIGPGRAPTAIPTGVTVAHTRDDPARFACRALIDGLHGNGFDATESPKPLTGRDALPHPSILIITVEARPEGAQGEAKLRAQKKQPRSQ